MSDRDGESWQRVISGALGRKALNNRARSFTNTRMAKEAREAQAQREITRGSQKHCLMQGVEMVERPPMSGKL